MKGNLQQQAIYRSQLERIISNYKKTSRSRRSSGYISGKIEAIKSVYQKFDDNHSVLAAADLSSVKDEKTQKGISEYLEGSQFEEFEDMYSEFLVELRDALTSLGSQQAANPVQSDLPSVQNVPLKLPTVEIPKFDGQYTAWQAFHDRFSSLIHNNDRLTPVDKLHYLKGSLTGEARRDLDAFDMTSANYMAAWELLCKRYNKRRLLIYAQLKRLFYQPRLAHESFKELRMMLDDLHHIRHALQVLKVSISEWDDIFVFVTAQRLPEKTRNQWEELISKTDELPSFEDFMKFLEERYRTLEAIKDFNTHKPTTQHKDADRVRNRTTNCYVNEEQGCPFCKGNHHSQYCRYLQRKSPAERSRIIKERKLCFDCIGSHQGRPCPASKNCPVCKEMHPLQQCIKFKGMDVPNRRILMRNSRLCFRCLRPHHYRICPSTNKCVKCGKGHHSLLCEEDKAELVDDTKAQDVTNCNYNENVTHSMLATALVRVKNNKGNSIILRAVIDPGSQSSFLTEAVYQTLQPDTIPTTMQITGLGSAKVASSKKIACFNLEATTRTKYSTAIQAYVVKAITDICPPKRSKWQDWSYIDGLELADPKFTEQGRIDILLGVKVYASIIENGIRKGHSQSPTAQKTSLGWILFGEVAAAPTQSSSRNFSGFTIAESNELKLLNQQIRKFWELEEVSEERKMTHEERDCEAFYEATTKRFPNGLYQVKLPFKGGAPKELGESKAQAASRFKQLEKKLLQRPDIKALYADCLKEYISMGHMRPITSKDQRAYYLPHHAVFKESTTTKVRVVFDASAKSSNGRSLNEQMLTGPTLQPKLYATLSNWRKHKYALTADIENMYRMILLDPADRRYQTILWREHSYEPIQEYQLNTVTIGTTPAPYLAIKTLQRLAADDSQRYPKASKVALSDFYVDDVLTGAGTIAEALDLQRELINLLKGGGFHLRKWAANHQELLEQVPPEDRELQLPLNLEEENQVKALGILWHPNQDYFSYAIKEAEFERSAITKRQILSEVAKLFDPLGWISPCVLIAKIIMQKLWLAGCGWDEMVGEELIEEWSEFKGQLHYFQELRVPRWINMYHVMPRYQLHGFCDASTRAYAAVVYIRTISNDGTIHVSLITSKTRIAPIKPTSLPRLELCGATLLARLMKQTQMDMRLEHGQSWCWTDSTIVLAWLRGLPNRWKTFVANRIVEINENTINSAWQYVPSKENPADLASRGIMPSKIGTSSIWWQGPKWLKESETSWPKRDNREWKTDLEKKNDITMMMVNDNKEQEWLNRFSSYIKGIRVIAYCIRFSKGCKGEKQATCSQLTADEINDARTRLVRLAQTKMFPSEYNQLQQGRAIQRNSQLIKLTPFLAADGTIRLGGRLRNARISYDQKHPMILQPKPHITNLIIDYYHKITLHGGPQLVLNSVRTHYWIINGMSTIKRRIRECTRCIRFRAIPPKQLMGDLPKARLAQTYPFQNVGLDFAGPVDLKMSKHKGSKIYKGYFCIFICMTTKATHIEVTSDMSSDAFVAAFRRFVGRRGLCENVYSDNGTNFVGANKMLQRQFKEITDKASAVAALEVAHLGIKWHFNPPAAPHFGGLWEAGIKGIKFHLKRSTEGKIFTFEELNTLLIQIESCLNSRPLWPLSADCSIIDALTPGHFLIGRNMQVVPDPDLQNAPNYLDRWKYVQQTLQYFWKRWSSEYLSQLQQRHKWFSKQPNVKVGQVVIIIEENRSPAQWPLGKIVEVHPGEDGHIRVVTLQYKAARVKRPISKICPLPA